MPRRPSHEGFWAVIDAARRLQRRGWRLGGMILRFRTRLRLLGVRWIVDQRVWLSEKAGRRAGWVDLAPVIPRTSLRRRAELRKRVTPLFVAAGWKPQPRNPGIQFERSFDGRSCSLRDWPRILRAFEVVPRLQSSAAGAPGSLRAVLQGLFRRGWSAGSVHAQAPERRCRARLPWSVGTTLAWDPSYGVSLSLSLEARKRVGPADLRTLQGDGFLDRLARELWSRGLRSAVMESLEEIWEGQPSPLTIFFNRDRIPPNSVVAAVDGLRDWKPSE